MNSRTGGHHRWTALQRSLPRSGLLLLGCLTVGVGVLLATRPLSSLQALGLYVGLAFVVLGGAALLHRRDQSDAWDTARASGGVVLGVLILLWLRHDFDLLALAVGAVLLISGVRRLWSPARRRLGGAAPTQSPVDRIANVLLGLAEILIGLLALRWPDLTLLAVALLFAVRLVVLGVHLVRRGLTRRERVAAPSTSGTRQDTIRPSIAAPWLRLTGGALALLLAAGAAFLGVEARTGAPVADAFYATPAGLPEQPGVLLRSEVFTRDVPEGADGWRILYTTTAADGSSATASGIVLTPTKGKSPAPVIAWAHGTTGWASHCAPTLLPHPFEAGAMPALEQVVAQGWALVATDYTGLGTPGPHPYLIGPGEGHSVLDAVRAAQQLKAAQVAPATVVWGHSQGGHAALWTGQLAPDYAPELDLRGIAAMAPAADVTALAASLPTVSGGELFASYVIAAYAAHHPEITLDQQVIPPARVLVHEMSRRCLGEPSILASLVSVLSLARDQSVYATPPTEGALGEALADNVPNGPFEVPILIAQGEADTLIQPADQQAYADRLCSAGRSPQLLTYPGRDHLSLVEPESDLIEDLVGWTTDRFEGRPAGAGCR